MRWKRLECKNPFGYNGYSYGVVPLGLNKTDNFEFLVMGGGSEIPCQTNKCFLFSTNLNDFNSSQVTVLKETLTVKDEFTSNLYFPLSLT
jgi:hypothetical protein